MRKTTPSWPSETGRNSDRVLRRWSLTHYVRVWWWFVAEGAGEGQAAIAVGGVGILNKLPSPPSSNRKALVELVHEIQQLGLVAAELGIARPPCI